MQKAIKLFLKENTTFDLVFLDGSVKRYDILSLADKFPQLNELKEYPYIGVVPRYQPIAKQGYRAIICKQNIIFYKVNESSKEIILNIIVSSKRNYINLI